MKTRLSSEYSPISLIVDNSISDHIELTYPPKSYSSLTFNNYLHIWPRSPFTQWSYHINSHRRTICFKLQSFTFDYRNSSPKSHPAIILQQLSGISSACRVFYPDFRNSTSTIPRHYRQGTQLQHNTGQALLVRVESSPRASDLQPQPSPNIVDNAHKSNTSLVRL